MRDMMILPIAALLASTAAFARDSRPADPDTLFASRIAGLVPGHAMSCISGRPSTQLEAIGPRLLYKVSRNLIYVNETNGGCEKVARGDALVTRSNGGRLCSGDIGQTVDLRASGMTTGSCALGEFIPYTRQ